MLRSRVAVIVEDGPQHRIKPSDIVLNNDGTILGSFGKMEVEVIVGRLIKFFHARGYWAAFKLSELAEFYKENGWDPDTKLFGLTGAWFNNSETYGGWQVQNTLLAFDESGKCRVTELFVEQCYKASQAALKVDAQV